MRKLGLVLLGIMLSNVPLVYSQDQTGFVTVGVTVSGATSLDVVSESGDGFITFPDNPVAFTMAPEYIEVDATSNYGTWTIAIYSDNFASPPSVETWGYAYGGLVDMVNENKLPLGWCAFDEPPATPEPTSIPGTGRWTYLKDKSDVDDPGTPANDESWASAFADGYANVAWGGPGYAQVANPYVAGGDTLTMPLYVYLETASDAAVGEYSGNVNFDLYHE